MKEVELIPRDHVERLNQVVDRSWQIFQSHFINERHPILREAPFQHHFANILSTVGHLYCVKRSDVFFVDLETKCENIRGKSKFIDIACSFPNANVSCAIELKFKTSQQGAQDHGRIDVYSDIEAVELACMSEFTFGRFYMITDSSVYVNKSSRGIGTQFCLHHGFQVVPGKSITSASKGRENVSVTLRHPHVFNWERRTEERIAKEGSGDWYFLEVRV